MLHFLYKDDGHMSVRVLDDSSCCRHYHNDDSDKDIDDGDDQL
jgi:hypothetical protein